MKTILMLPATVEGSVGFAGMLGMILPAAFRERLVNSRVGLALRAVLTAPAQALRETKIGNILSLPANYVRQLGANAKEANRPGFAAKANARADKLASMGQRAEAAVSRGTAPMRNVAGRALDVFQTTVVGNPVHRALGKLSAAGLKRAEMRHDVHMKRAMAAFTSEGRGFLARMGDKIFSRSVPKVAAGELASVMGKVNNGLIGAEKSAHLKAVAKEVQALSLTGEAGHRASAVVKHLNRAAGRAAAVEHWGAAAGGSLTTMLGSALKVVARVPALYAMVGVAAAAGLGALALKSRAASARSDATLREVNTYIVDSGSGFAQALRQSLSGQKAWAVADGAIHAVGEVADAALWANPNSMGMGLMAPQFGATAYDMMRGAHAPEALKDLPTRVPNNMLLNACALLSAGDSGEVPITNQQRVYLVRTMIGAIPNVAVSGGIYNRLGAAMSQEMVARGMKLPEMIKIVSDDTALTNFGAEVSAKMKEAAKPAEAAPVAAAQANHVAIQAPANDGAKPQHGHRAANAHAVTASTAGQRYAAAEKPPTMVAANDARAHLGTVASTPQHRVG